MNILGIHLGRFAYVVFAVLLALAVMFLFSTILSFRLNEAPQFSRRKAQDLWAIIGLVAFILLFFLFMFLTIYPSAL